MEGFNATGFQYCRFFSSLKLQSNRTKKKSYWFVTSENENNRNVCLSGDRGRFAVISIAKQERVNQLKCLQLWFLFCRWFCVVLFYFVLFGSVWILILAHLSFLFFSFLFSSFTAVTLGIPWHCIMYTMTSLVFNLVHDMNKLSHREKRPTINEQHVSFRSVSNEFSSIMSKWPNETTNICYTFFPENQLNCLFFCVCHSWKWALNESTTKNI